MNAAAVSSLRERALGVLGHLQGPAPRRDGNDHPGRRSRALCRCVLGLRARRIVAVPLAPGNADEHKAKFFRVLERLTRRASRPNARSSTASRPSPSPTTLRRASPPRSACRVHGRNHRHYDPQCTTPPRPTISRSCNIPPARRANRSVVLTHRNVMTNIDAIAAGVGATPEDSSLSWMPLTHDMG